MNGSIYDLHATPLEKLLGVRQLRRELLSHAQGKTLEIGAGTGFNFPYYPENLEITAIEPDPGMRKNALIRAQRRGQVTVGDAEAESLPFPDETFDTVVATLALCSVDDPPLAIREAYRVLKPQGRFLVMEHIRKNTVVAGKLLDWLNPGWKRISDGCHLNRPTDQWIQQSPFKVERQDSIWGGYGSVWVLKQSDR